MSSSRRILVGLFNYVPCLPPQAKRCPLERLELGVRKKINISQPCCSVLDVCLSLVSTLNIGLFNGGGAVVSSGGTWTLPHLCRGLSANMGNKQSDCCQLQDTDNGHQQSSDGGPLYSLGSLSGNGGEKMNQLPRQMVMVSTEQEVNGFLLFITKRERGLLWSKFGFIRRVINNHSQINKPELLVCFLMSPESKQ